jgi:hypothetical protein
VCTLWDTNQLTSSEKKYGRSPGYRICLRGYWTRKGFQKVQGKVGSCWRILHFAIVISSQKDKVPGRDMKYIIVTGGVISGLGKGITISSIGRILKSCGLNVTSIKIDPYLNIDAGTMSPFEHGETYVLDDGGETDLDLGNYERFLDITLTSKHNITTGKIYRDVSAL